MNALLILIPLSLVLLVAALWAFAWAVKRGQFDDLDTPAIAILAEDEPAPERDGNAGIHDSRRGLQHATDATAAAEKKS